MVPESTEIALLIKELHCTTRSHWTFRSKEILHGISLSIMKGETFGFLGHNGAGKTTTIKSILGLLRPTKGTIEIFGVQNSIPQSRALVGYLAEQPYFYDYLTVRETVALYATLAGVRAAELDHEVSRALELVRITGRSKSPLRTLSKGLTQRVGLAQAIVARPKLLILDEPFSGLDPIGRKDFRDLLVHLKSLGTTIFMSSHILGDVEFLCDRVSILSHGTLKGVFAIKDIPRLATGSYELIVGKGPIAVDLANSSGANVRDMQNFICLSFPTRPEAELALSLAIQRQIHVESFTFHQGSLEDLFVKMVQFEEGADA